MTVSSRTPEGWPNACPICGREAKIEPSADTADGTCPSCGTLIWLRPPVGEGAELTHFPDDFVIPKTITEVITESTARENSVLAVGYHVDELIVASPTPLDNETVDKLRFILDRNLQLVIVSAEWFSKQLEQVYG